MMSVSSTFVNDGGTMVCLRKLDEVIGIERDAAGCEGAIPMEAGAHSGGSILPRIAPMPTHAKNVASHKRPSSH